MSHGIMKPKAAPKPKPISETMQKAYRLHCYTAKKQNTVAQYKSVENYANAKLS